MAAMPIGMTPYDLGTSERVRRSARICVFFVLLAFLVSVTCTCYTPLVPCILGRHDQAMFYMQGKAICHGLVPYVDFADVKGPLLLYSFALGYWIDPGGVWGIVLLQTALYSITLCSLFFSAGLLGLPGRLAVISVVLTLFVMSAPFLVCGSDGACRAEDFMAAEVSVLLYALIRYYTLGRPEDAKLLGWVTGLAFACSILIKYNNILAPMAALFMAFLTELHHRRSSSAMGVIVRFCCGASFMIGVFVFVLWQNDALMACKEIYVDFNVETLHNMYCREHVVRGSAIGNKFFYAIPVLLAIMVFRLLVTGMGKPWFLTGKWVLGLFASAAMLPNLLGPFDYYLAASLPLAILVFIPIMRKFPRLEKKRYFYPALALLLVYLLKFDSVWSHRGEAESFVENVRIVEREIAATQHPTILYNCLDIGLGFDTAVLPACRFWCCLNGGYERCSNNQIEAINNRKVDFCCLRGDAPKYRAALESSGYHKLCEFAHPVRGFQYVVYKKH